MENMIRYLYEYRDGRRVRNVGFVKAEQDEAAGALQIHGRATFLHQADIRVYLFFMERDNCYGIPMGELHGVQSILSARLSYDREEIEKYTDYDAIRGVILDAGEQGTYAAVWDESVVAAERMRLAKERTKTPFQENLKSGEEEDMEAERESAAETEAEIETKAASEPEPVTETDTAMDTGSVPKQEVENELCEEPVEELIEELIEEPSEEPEEENQTGSQYRKVRREDLMELPRKEWYLANNNFLMHGYRNYRHLLFADEGEEFYIGVPGIYHPREAAAARSFGFPDFKKISQEECENLGLSAQEMNTEAVFGYWCRRINLKQRPNK